MCEFCKNIRKIKEQDEYKHNPLDAETDEFPHREKLVLAKLRGKVIFYGFNKYHYEDDSIYENVEVNFCPECGRKLRDG